MTLLIILGTLALGLLAQAYVKSMFSRYSRVPGSSGYTGAQAATEILRRNGVSGVTLHEHDGFLGDHYDPIHRRLVLSASTVGRRPVAGLKPVFRPNLQPAFAASR